MNLLTRRTRSALALSVVAVAVPFAASAHAAPVRTADTSTYTSAKFLQSALGLPASETNPAIKSVTYDRFQWILQQEGKYAILIGDPATDDTFKARAQDVEIAADAAGVKDVYWFNPNLSGNAKVGAHTEPTIDIRDENSSAVTVQKSRDVISQTWKNLIGQYFGNGLKALDGATAIPADWKDPARVNDYGVNDGFSTEVGNVNGGALYHYVAGAAPDDLKESYFLVYDKDRTVTPPAGTPQPSKIAAWIDLTDATSQKTQADFATAIGVIGAGNISASSEFSWWKSANNAKQYAASASDAQGKNVPVLTDADNAAGDGGWRVHQVSYPELVFLLKTENSKTVPLLFGGTWCPNTRPVIQAVNRNAQEQNVTVFNFDTILDGGVFGGGNSGSNPLQVRGNHGSGTVPASLYGDVVDQFFTNLKTQYTTVANDLGASVSPVKYFPGGDTSKPEILAKKLQVPFVLGYQGKEGDAPNGGVTRQWIIKNANGSYTEYMGNYYYTRPQPNQLNITNIPLNAPIWTKLNADLASYTWKTDLATVQANTAIDTDDADFLVAGDTATVTYVPAKTTVPVAPANVNVTLGGTLGQPGVVDASPAGLAAAIAEFGTPLPANAAAAKAAYLAAKAAAPADDALIAKLTKLYGVWGAAQVRKGRINTVWGSATTPSSVAGGIASIRALDVFFGGLPGGVVSTRKVTADPVDSATAAKVKITIANEFERTPTGNVSLVAKQGGTTVATQSAAVADGSASFTLPVLPAGDYDLALSYAADDQLAAFTENGALKVTQAETKTQDPGKPQSGDQPAAGGKPAVTTTPAPAPAPLVKVKASKLAGAVAKAPTRTKAGTYKVTITAASGRAAATGKVTLTLKKGKTKKVLTGTVVGGVVTIKVPKLAKGTWKATISWAGDTNHLAAKVSGAAIKVKK